jgi:hypothetical protein
MLNESVVRNRRGVGCMRGTAVSCTDHAYCVYIRILA